MAAPQGSDTVVQQWLLILLAAASVFSGVFLFYGTMVRSEDALAARISVLESNTARVADGMETLRRAVEDIRVSLTNKVDRK